MHNIARSEIEQRGVQPTAGADERVEEFFRRHPQATSVKQVIRQTGASPAAVIRVRRRLALAGELLPKQIDFPDGEGLTFWLNPTLLSIPPNIDGEPNHLPKSLDSQPVRCDRRGVVLWGGWKVQAAKSLGLMVPVKVDFRLDLKRRPGEFHQERARCHDRDGTASKDLSLCGEVRK